MINLFDSYPNFANEENQDKFLKNLTNGSTSRRNNTKKLKYDNNMQLAKKFKDARCSVPDLKQCLSDEQDRLVIRKRLGQKT